MSLAIALRSTEEGKEVEDVELVVRWSSILQLTSIEHEGWVLDFARKT